MIEAIVFDFDGLIIDTESAWYEALAEMFRQQGAELPLEKWTLCVGADHSVFDPYNYLEEMLQKPIDRDTLKAEVSAKHSKIMMQRSLRPGVRAYLEAAMLLKLKVGIASSSHRSWVEDYLRRFGVEHYFSCIHTADDVSKIKPDPELYLKAIASLGVSASTAVAFEDSPNGTRAAMAAGLRCVIVPNSITKMLDFDNYTMRMNSMADMELSEVLDKLNAGAY